MDIHESTEILLQTAREYASSNARPGDVVAAAYRLAAAKLVSAGGMSPRCAIEHGMHDTAKDFERAAAAAEKQS